ncbi:MAG: hypothetical protein J1F27_01120 [Prevotellaceae bacterium]|nr:hypothetical protein [Prevotellaceae bacterium]
MSALRPEAYRVESVDPDNKRTGLRGICLEDGRETMPGMSAKDISQNSRLLAS